MRSRGSCWTAVGLVFVVLLSLGVTASGCADDPEPAPATCDAGDHAFVRRALLALNGRRAYGQAEVSAWVDTLARLRSRKVAPEDARDLVVRAMMHEDESFRERWSEFLMDALSVVRARFVRSDGWDLVQAKLCYGPRLVDANDGGALAAWVRDNPPTVKEGAPFPKFTLGRLLASTIELDDLTPIYRAQLFHMMAFPIAGANLEVEEREAARRTDLGRIFEEAYLHRDPTCLPCHNSGFSRTADADPDENRFYSIDAPFEEALYGNADATMRDHLAYRSVFRLMGVRELDEGDPPWGWDRVNCGAFKAAFQPDPLGVEARFGSVGVKTDGLKASVWDLEAALNRGFQALRKNGPEAIEGDLDPDVALAYLVAANIVEKVWEEVMGTPLTVSHFFPRNETQRDLLKSLTATFIGSGFSLKTLLSTIVRHPYFNLAPPEMGCGAGAYGLDPVFNPWSVDSAEAEKRGNSPADGVFHLQSRVLRRSLHVAMDWPPPIHFPNTDEDEALQTSLGFFIANFKQGFRGLGFQARLSWEEEYGGCARRGNDDFITSLVSKARSTPDATVADAIIALKDRLLSEATITDVERGPLEDLLGVSLDTPLTGSALDALDGQLRRACGAYIASPQFLLSGVAPLGGGSVPRLTPPEHSYDKSCEAIAEMFDEANLQFRITCQGGSVVAVLR